jgi:DNA-binding CsgD family transcriptional regulator
MSGRRRLRWIETPTVIAHAHLQCSGRVAAGDRRCPATGVLARVRHRLGHDANDLGLDVRRVRAWWPRVLDVGGNSRLAERPLRRVGELFVQRGRLVSRAVLAQEAELLDLRRRHDSLSEREREVMAGVVAGHLTKRVAAALGISEITVEAHRGKVMRKVGAASLAELVTMAMRLGLASVPGTQPGPVASALAGYGMIGLTGRGSRPPAFARAG